MSRVLIVVLLLLIIYLFLEPSSSNYMGFGPSHSPPRDRFQFHKIHTTIFLSIYYIIPRFLFTNYNNNYCIIRIV
jgi:hypothetical protein